MNIFYKKRFNKYIVSSLAASMIFASSLVCAAEDSDIVIFGGHFESEVSSDDVSNNANDNYGVNTDSNSDNTGTDNNNNEAGINTNEFDNTFSNEANPTINKNEIENESHNSNGENVAHNVDETNLDVNVNTNNADNSSNRSNNINSSNDTSESTNNIMPLTNSNNLNDSSDNIYIKPNYNNSSNNTNEDDSDTHMKKQKARFIKLFSDDTYNYYLDRKSVRWIRVPYLNSEYMADVWIRMIEKKPNDENMSDDMYRYINENVDDEITEARAKGILYDEVDIIVLRTKKYLLEHYYIRPKTQQIQFLCELEVFGRPQNAIKERAYDYKNWENLIPGSIEFAIYYSVLSDIGTSKASERGHMTAADMIEEYARISIR